MLLRRAARAPLISARAAPISAPAGAGSGLPKNGLPIMMARLSCLVAAPILAVALTACEDKTIAEIPFAEIKAAAAGGDAEAFKARFEDFKGKRVQWPGTVVSATRQFGDDYAETGLLLVDLDSTPDGVGDAESQIKPSQLESLEAGKPVTLTAVIREYSLKDGKLLLRVETKELN
jgi:hypothetical protein